MDFRFVERRAWTYCPGRFARSSSLDASLGRPELPQGNPASSEPGRINQDLGLAWRALNLDASLSRPDVAPGEPWRALAWSTVLDLGSGCGLPGRVLNPDVISLELWDLVTSSRAGTWTHPGEL